ncbi:PREDICTED: tudor domain-containing protein 7-like isoform X1 [Acromyrmex echinatior]|uniref:tudor domain-containing protein 7-like isoform X1 n=1 Tax=Acromyrmex echinatior TaxID=103372 RepID=UPI000580FDBE|nr:PREDICTED: tudor domain-containing protein 7-like isoform X1 [Acromyrmex echinatior]XP_011061567.1 PREDICTED: tudor domain-containing protein 7-like isoform X1 [Acromyrmex echinatior]XP_011061576.1 PREDICTED: tudor domain-containing protein 7-like isoform X1 [Acromyrmex echinatior]
MDQDEVIKKLRSCLISCKGGIKLENLRTDYRMITGELLPFKQLGYSSVEAFVRNVPDVTVTKKNGELFVEALPSKTSAHLTKLVSRQKNAKRKIRPQPKKWTPPRHVKGFSSSSRSFSGSRNNNLNSGFYSSKNNYISSSNSFTRSTPDKSNSYTDFTRPVPLMETIVQCPYPLNNTKSSFTPTTPPPSICNSPISTFPKRLTDKVTIPSLATVNQSDNCKTIEDVRFKVLNDNTASSVINQKPKTVESKSSKLSDRLKITPPETPLPSISNYNNGYTSMSTPSIFNVPQDEEVAPPLKALDSRKELEVRANMLNLPPPIYKMYSKKEKHSVKVTIYASVKVGSHTFHTYPEDAATEEEAEKIAARLALGHLAKESTSSEVTTADAELIKKRILKIITTHHSGVFMHLLPEYYNEQYGETLPHNWQTIIEKCVDINQEKGVGDSTILCLTSPTLKRLDSNSVLKNIPENILLTNKKIQLNPIGPATPSILPVPEAHIWQVCVTYVVNTVEIWVRLGDDNNEFVDMTNEMTSYYDKLNKPTSSVACVPGDFYAVLEENYWHRVECTDYDNETGIATVFFIDQGYVEQYKSDVLHPLDKKFNTLPFQAIRIGLQGLKEFRDCAQMVTEIENYLLVDQLFYVKVHGMDSDEYGSYVTVTFYDTSKGDEDIDVNQILIDKILEVMAVTFKMRVGQLIELNVTHIDEYGKVYTQLNSFTKNILSNENMFQFATNNIKVNAINFTKTYLAEWNSQWYRARVTDIPAEQEVMVFLIDVGKIVLIPRANLFHIDKTSKTLQCIPPQAMQIFLHNIDQSMYNKRFVAKFQELVSDTDMLVARVIRISNSGVPVVEIFKRVGPSNMLASINTSLIYAGELSKIKEDSNNNNKSKKRLDRKSTRAPEIVGKLNPPVISDIGQYFDVHVTLVAHPGHFIVQPLNNVSQLREMMIDLRKYYDANNNPPLESVNEGKLYAGKLQDDWYRVYVTDIISDNDVSVYLCDYGDVTIISISNLQPLMSKFLKLPYQAVKAKLVGIEPLNVDWTVTDCVKFKDLVLDKDFVSVIVESVFDSLSPVNGTMLGLKLIDTSTEKDIYIDELLVEEKRAKYIEEVEGLPS